MREQGANTFATLIGAHVRQRSLPLFMDFGADFGVAVLRPTYEIDNDPVFRPGLWFGRVWVGVGWSSR